MKYNIKSLAKGALTATAGLAMLASTGCQTIESAKPEKGAYLWKFEDLSSTKKLTNLSGKLTSEPKIISGNPDYMELKMIRNGTNAVSRIDFDATSESGAMVKEIIFPRFILGSKISIGYEGKETPRISANSIKKVSATYFR